MEIHIWTFIILPLFIAIISASIQLVVEYTIFKRFFEHQGEKIEQPLSPQIGTVSPNVEIKPFSVSDILLSVSRVLVVFVLTFGSVSVAASIGFELQGIPGLLWGVIVSLMLNLIALWAIKTWSEQIAKIASALSLVILFVLGLSGLGTLGARLAGFSIYFSGGFTIVLLGAIFLIVVAILFVLSIIAEMFPNSGFAKSYKSYRGEDSQNTTRNPDQFIFEQKPKEEKIFCEYCGVGSQSKKYCTGPGYQHHFISGFEPIYCDFCGEKPGGSKICKKGKGYIHRFSSHPV